VGVISKAPSLGVFRDFVADTASAAVFFLGFPRVGAPEAPVAVIPVPLPAHPGVGLVPPPADIIPALHDDAVPLVREARAALAARFRPAGVLEGKGKQKRNLTNQIRRIQAKMTAANRISHKKRDVRVMSRSQYNKYDSSGFKLVRGADEARVYAPEELDGNGLDAVSWYMVQDVDGNYVYVTDDFDTLEQDIDSWNPDVDYYDDEFSHFVADHYDEMEEWDDAELDRRLDLSRKHESINRGNALTKPPTHEQAIKREEPVKPKLSSFFIKFPKLESVQPGSPLTNLPTNFVLRASDGKREVGHCICVANHILIPRHVLVDAGWTVADNEVAYNVNYRNDPYVGKGHIVQQVHTSIDDLVVISVASSNLPYIPLKEFRSEVSDAEITVNDYVNRKQSHGKILGVEDGLIKHSSSTVPGCSGTPLYQEGKIVGIHIAGGEGANSAIPIPPTLLQFFRKVGQKESNQTNSRARGPVRRSRRNTKEPSFERSSSPLDKGKGSDNPAAFAAE